MKAAAMMKGMTRAMRNTNTDKAWRESKQAYFPRGARKKGRAFTMIKRVSMLLAGLVLVIGVSASSAFACNCKHGNGNEDPYETEKAPAKAPKDTDAVAMQLLTPYLAMRAALAADMVKDVDKNAAQFAAIAKDGISKAEKNKRPKEYVAALKNLRSRVQRLTKKGLGIEQYREHFGTLSDLFTAFVRANVSAKDAETLQLYYCGMEKHFWLEKAPEKIGNPYFGKSMPDCGEKNPIHAQAEPKKGGCGGCGGKSCGGGSTCANP